MDPMPSLIAGDRAVLPVCQPGEPMQSLIRPRLFAVALLLAGLAGGTYYLASAKADDRTATASGDPIVARTSGGHGLILGSKDSAQPETMEQFLTGVIENVDRYWTQAFKDSGLPEPKVTYKWIPAGQTAASACGDEDGTLGDSAAAYCPGDDTIYISQKFATDIYDGALDNALPGSSQGYGRTMGDFAVAYIVAHEYGHQVQAELGLFDGDGQQVATVASELQADCYAGTWAKSASEDNRLEDGDVQEALDAAQAVGDFKTGDPSHHGTPEQREQAWSSGFEAGDPSACGAYVDGAGVGDAGPAQQLRRAGSSPVVSR
jgi:predicted metalloprotease